MINKFSIHKAAKYFSPGKFQNYLVFISDIKHVKYFHGNTQIYSWKSYRMSEEIIENIAKSDSSFAPTFVDHHSLPDINFNRHCLIKNNIFIPKNVINFLRELLIYFLHITHFTLCNCWFGSVKLTRKTHLDKYKYTGQGIRFDSCGEYSLPDGNVDKNVIILGVDMSSPGHIDNKEKDFLIVGKGPAQGLDATTFSAEAKYLLTLHNPKNDLY